MDFHRNLHRRDFDCFARLSANLVSLFLMLSRFSSVYGNTLFLGLEWVNEL